MKLNRDDLLLFAKVSPDAVIPTKRKSDSGYDCYACFESDYVIVEPHSTELVPLGIASAFTDKWAFVLKERSSVGSKGQIMATSVVDSSYRGEIFACIGNLTDKKFIIIKEHVDRKLLEEDLKTRQIIYHPYSKAIVQGLVLPVPEMEVQEIDYLDLKEIESDRGTGCLGSSGK